jgi:hypothetical protein
MNPRKQMIQDDDGSANLENFIAREKFTRTALNTVCEQSGDQLEVIIFLHNKGVWAELLESDINRIWGVDGLTKAEFCNGLNGNVFKLAAPHLITFKRALNERHTSDVIGLYKNPGNTHLLVVRVPVTYRSAKLAAGLGGGALTYLGLTGLGLRPYFRQPEPLD